MTVKKLSDSDKNEILKLYRETGETTSTLAERYDVSNSTISRFLKTTLPEAEYEELIQQKRAARTFVKEATPYLPLFSQPEPEVLVVEEPSVEVKSSPDTEPTPIAKQLRRRPSVVPSEVEMPAADLEVGLTNKSVNTLNISLNPPQPLLDTNAIPNSSPTSPIKENEGLPAIKPELLDPQPLKIATPRPNLVNEDLGRAQGNQPQRLDRPTSVVGSNPTSLDEDSDAEASSIAEILGEDLLDGSEDLMDLDDEDLEDLDDDYLDDDTPILTRRVSSETLVQVLPLSEATLPRTCYLVIDRLSELITRPLKDFSELGQIPSQEVHEKTLPIFDNHRIARRFSTKRDRVIKVPDSKLLQKTCSQLQAKGITRLLVDGQVYSLSK